MRFLDEYFPKDIDYGSGFSIKFAVDEVRTAGGDEHRSLLHPFVVASLDVDFTRLQDDVIKRVIDLNMRAAGTFRGFRVRNFLDFSTNHYRGEPTALDQRMLPLGGLNYQLMRWYGDSSDAECSRRRIRKPEPGTVKVAVSGVEMPAAQWSVNNSNGIVTFAANNTRAITAITKAAQAVLTVGSNSYAVGQVVYVVGVVGMTQINGLRATITARTTSTITLNVNSTAFGTYTSGGAVHTAPQPGEVVTAGCRFDIPMRFTDDLSGSFNSFRVLTVSGVGLIEILNPA